MQDNVNDHYLEEDDLDSIDGLSLPNSQPDRSYLEDYNEKDNMSGDNQGDEGDSEETLHTSTQRESF